MAVMLVRVENGLPESDDREDDTLDKDIKTCSFLDWIEYIASYHKSKVINNNVLTVILYCYHLIEH